MIGVTRELAERAKEYVVEAGGTIDYSGLLDFLTIEEKRSAPTELIDLRHQINEYVTFLRALRDLTEPKTKIGAAIRERLSKLTFPRCEHYPPYRISYRYDCNFFKKADTIEEAVNIGLAKHRSALICVHINIRGRKVDQGLYAWQCEGKSREEIYLMFDEKGDEHFHDLNRRGLW